MPPVAALDLGSNTLKITVAERDPRGKLSVLGEASRLTRIGQGLDTRGSLSPEAIERTLRGLAELMRFAHELGATEVACVGTAGLRGASNAQDFLERTRRELGLEVEIIDGLREAELAFRGPVESHGDGPLIVSDIGGRSTEVVVGSQQGIESRISLELGSVRLTERHLHGDPPTPEERHALAAHLERARASLPLAAREAKLIGVSGTVLSLMGLYLDVDTMEEAVSQGEGRGLPRSAVAEILQALAQKPAAERIRGTVLPEGRADVIVAGAHILAWLLDHYDRPEIIVSGRGVRYGLLFERTR